MIIIFDDLQKIESDTITLTKIVDNVSNNTKKEQLIEIIEEIRNVKVVLVNKIKFLRIFY